MNYDQLFAGRFLKAGEFRGKPVTLTITRVYLEDMEQEDGTEKHQAIVAFKETKRELALNKTNAQMIVAMFGAESDDWAGHKITMGPEPDKSGKSDSGQCIRIKGSPELTATITMQVKLPRRKPITRKLERTGAVTASPVDEFAELDAPSTAPIPGAEAGPEPASAPLRAVCPKCDVLVALTPDVTEADVADMTCDDCGTALEVAP